MLPTFGLRFKLSVFMFLQYFIWGSWFPSMGAYLAKRVAFSSEQIGAAYSAFAVGAIVSPVFVGLIADRFFPSEKILATLAALGAVLLFALAHFEHFATFYTLLILYCASFVPTLALGNSLALTHLSDGKKNFPRIKIFSALGWIAGGVTLSLLNGERSNLQFYLAGIASLAFAAFCLTLPHTPPQRANRQITLGEVLGVDALSLFKRPSFAVFIGCMFLISIPLKSYYVMTAIYLTELQWPNVAGQMALAQVSDIVFLFLMPLILVRLGYKKAILLGVFAWVVRFLLFSQSVTMPTLQTTFIYTAILLHGICYDFLYIAAQLYVNAEANDRNRAAAQGLIAFILWGLSALVGTLLSGKLLALNKLAAPSGVITYDWQTVWLVPALVAAGVMIVFALAFRSPTSGANANAITS